MEFGRTDITVALGQRGCGKSTLTRRVLSAYPRAVIIDRLREWSYTPGVLITDNFIDFTELLRRNFDKDSFRVVLQFDVEAERKDEIFSHAMRLCYYFGRSSGRSLAVLIEEIHHFAGPTSIDPWLFECIMSGRHAGLAILGNSQRPASVSKALISQASHVFIGQLFERRDLEYLSATVGEGAEAAARLPKFSFLHYSPGSQITSIKLSK